MLWVGNPAVLPLDPVVLDDGTGYTLTRNGPGNVTEQWRAPEHSADKLVDRAIELSVAGLTNRLGRMLAPMGVRYVVLPSTQGTGGGANAPPSPALRTALSAQLDLARLRSEPGLVLYENLAWIPLRAVVPAAQAGDVPVGSADPTRAALGVDLSTAQPGGIGSRPRGHRAVGRSVRLPLDRELRRAPISDTSKRSAGRTATASRRRAPSTSPTPTSGSAGRCSAAPS